MWRFSPLNPCYFNPNDVWSHHRQISAHAEATIQINGQKRSVNSRERERKREHLVPHGFLLNTGPETRTISDSINLYIKHANLRDPKQRFLRASHQVRNNTSFPWTSRRTPEEAVNAKAYADWSSNAEQTHRPLRKRHDNGRGLAYVTLRKFG